MRHSNTACSQSLYILNETNQVSKQKKINTKTKDILKVEPRFVRLLPVPKQQNEITQIIRAILKYGPIDPIVVWDDIIIDGYIRYLICKEYKIPYSLQRLSFGSDMEASEWIIKHHRRYSTTKRLVKT